MSSFTPLHDIVLVSRDDASKTSSGGIALVAKTNDVNTGTVLAVGPGRYADHSADFIETTLKVGDRIIFPKTSGYGVELFDQYPDAKELIVMREIEVIGRFSN